ncbi:MAG: hypothetical protein M1818_004569 [Claussenomyces sp. TS43310]|nr:MAG: hypothetical protein M1818_004569 [Claussenomyces sp. TS43310]
MKFSFRGLGSKKKEDKRTKHAFRSSPERRSPSYQTSGVYTDFTCLLPAPLLGRIFSYVCPHAEDETYESCEHSASDGGCMLCDLRDLAQCARVSRRWRKLALNIFIRIDPVHYCEREDVLAEKRKRRRFDRNAEPDDTAQARLSLLCRTIRVDNPGLGHVVRFIKLPYITRETSKVDLARLVAGCPQLRYVDLPEGFFTGDQSCASLKQEVQARCPEMRKMNFLSGSEASLEMLAGGTIWRRLEVLELNKLEMDPMILRAVLGMLSELRALKITNMNVDDTFFQSDRQVPPFPAFTELLLEETPRITSAGMLSYLASPSVRANLLTLSLTTTGVHPGDLRHILSAAPELTSLSVVDCVSSPFPTSSSQNLGNSPDQTPVPLLTSESLQVLHYEIISTGSPRYNDPKSSYYAYLSSSLLANSLPNLRALYVRDVDFASSLVAFAPPRPAFAGEIGHTPFNSKNPFSQHDTGPFAASGGHRGGGGLCRELEVYTKGTDSLEWDFSYVKAASGGRGRHGKENSLSSLNIRPISSYGLASGGGRDADWSPGQLSATWNGTFSGKDVRKSIVVSNGMGGFLSVPDPEGRPASSGSGSGRGEWPSSTPWRDEKTGSRYDMWR